MKDGHHFLFLFSSEDPKCLDIVPADGDSEDNWLFQASRMDAEEGSGVRGTGGGGVQESVRNYHSRVLGKLHPSLSAQSLLIRHVTRDSGEMGS